MHSSADARTRTVEHTGAIVDGANRCRSGSGSTTNTERASAAQAHTAQLCCRGSSRLLRHSRTPRGVERCTGRIRRSAAVTVGVPSTAQEKTELECAISTRTAWHTTCRVQTFDITGEDSSSSRRAPPLCVRCWPAPCSSCPLLLFAALAAGRSPPGACGWAQSSAELFSSALVKGGEAS